jgi:hypothetical protein
MTVYFIQPENEPFVKIGFSNAPAAQRAYDLQMGNHRRLRIIAELPGTREDEYALHALFKTERLHREWFKFTKRVRKIVEGLAAGEYQIPPKPKSGKTPEQIAASNKRRGPRKRTKKDRRMPWDQVLKLYLDPRLSNDELEDACAKGYSRMSYDTMRRHFKRPRGAPVGRPSANRKPAIL